MRISGVGIEQLAQLTHALVKTDALEIADERNDAAASSRCFGLVGTLGAGKTRFCQELARACGVDPAEVTSPTFTLLKSYHCHDDSNLSGTPSQANVPRTHRGPKELHHLDLYRVVDEDELWELGLEELWESAGAWTLIEWADRFADALPSDTIWIRIFAPADSAGLREIELETSNAQHQLWLREVAASLVKIGFTGTIALD
jgi:tRNA threonylcarbamoyladenosine biosynthesis protein TsaE